jgi:hypothetical protein
VCEIVDILLSHRDEFVRKEEERRDETNMQFVELFNMVQGIIDSCAEANARWEEERLAAARRKPCM